jgi:hypothetical protein
MRLLSLRLALFLLPALLTGCCGHAPCVQANDDTECDGSDPVPTAVKGNSGSLIAKNAQTVSLVAEGGTWGTIKGQIIWGGDKVPAAEKIKPSQDAPHCLGTNPTADPAEGTILNDSLVINPKNKGLENAFVFILPEAGKKIPVHPNAPKPGKTVEIDQPCCTFVPRAMAIQEGDIVICKNNSPVTHNFNWTGDEAVGNKGKNETLPAGSKVELKGLKPQRLPISYSCGIHPWMGGRLYVLPHPYFAITDKDGKFEIPNAPTGAYKLMYYHEAIGYLGGAKGRNGYELTIKSGVNDRGTLKMGGTD